MASYKNLVLKGGGVRGIAYLGALEYLYANGLMRPVERVAGTSAGAITAALVALNFESFSAMRKVADGLDYRKVPSEGEMEPEPSRSAGVASLARKYTNAAFFRNIRCSMRLVQDLGWYSSVYVYNWLRSTIADRFSVAKDSYTFADFRDASLHKDGREFLDLYVTGTDLSNRTVRVFSCETTPDMEVALAVRISMSIPFYFEAMEYLYPGTGTPQSYADGGIMWNYPITLFDNARYGMRKGAGSNPETLGFFLYESADPRERKDIKGIADYVGAVFESLVLVQERLVISDERNRERTVYIDDTGVPITDFNVGLEDPVFQRLYRSGFDAAEQFFAKRTNWDMILHRIQTKIGWFGS